MVKMVHNPKYLVAILWSNPNNNTYAYRNESAGVSLLVSREEQGEYQEPRWNNKLLHFLYWRHSFLRRCTNVRNHQSIKILDHNDTSTDKAQCTSWKVRSDLVWEVTNFANKWQTFLEEKIWSNGSEELDGLRFRGIRYDYRQRPERCDENCICKGIGGKVWDFSYYHQC